MKDVCIKRKQKKLNGCDDFGFVVSIKDLTRAFLAGPLRVPPIVCQQPFVLGLLFSPAFFSDKSSKSFATRDARQIASYSFYIIVKYLIQGDSHPPLNHTSHPRWILMLFGWILRRNN